MKRIERARSACDDSSPHINGNLGPGPRSESTPSGRGPGRPGCPLERPGHCLDASRAPSWTVVSNLLEFGGLLVTVSGPNYIFLELQFVQK